MLTFDALTVSYGNKNILDAVSFGVTPGKITVLLGQNGEGKSTLFRCVHGLCPYTGHIFWQDTPISTMSPRTRARCIGVLPQVLPQTSFTAQTLISLGRSPYTGTTGRLSPLDREQVARAIALTGVESLVDRRVDTLSGGERKRVFLAMLLAQDPELLLLDEPVSSLDTESRHRFYALLRQLVTQDGKTVLLILHDLTEAMEIAENVVILQEGRVAFAGSRADCLDTHALENAFGVCRYPCGDLLFFR